MNRCFIFIVLELKVKSKKIPKKNPKISPQTKNAL